MSRALPEWIGATPDAKIPARVGLRVFERFGGVCQLSQRKIHPGDAWQIDHIIALVNGGEHRESNLQPVLTEPHKAKTRQDVALKAKSARVRKKHLGLHQPKARLPGSRGSKFKRKVGGAVVLREEE